MRLERPEVHIGFRIDNVHHHTVPGFSFLFGCVLQGPVVTDHTPCPKEIDGDSFEAVRKLAFLRSNRS